MYIGILYLPTTFQKKMVTAEDTAVQLYRLWFRPCATQSTVPVQSSAVEHDNIFSGFQSTINQRRGMYARTTPRHTPWDSSSRGQSFPFCACSICMIPDYRSKQRFFGTQTGEKKPTIILYEYRLRINMHVYTRIDLYLNEGTETIPKTHHKESEKKFTPTKNKQDKTKNDGTVYTYNE